MQIVSGLCEYLLLDPQLLLERWYGHGFVIPSVLSVLQKLSMGLGAHAESGLTELDFIGKLLADKKMVKMTQKR